MAATVMQAEISHEDWLDKGEELFGDDPLDWKFVCPVCGHVACGRDWKEAGAPSTAMAFSCVGRWSGHMDTDMGEGQPCNYAGGGLFRLNPVPVRMPDGKVHHAFAFADESLERTE